MNETTRREASAYFEAESLGNGTVLLSCPSPNAKLSYFSLSGLHSQIRPLFTASVFISHNRVYALIRCKFTSVRVYKEYTTLDVQVYKGMYEEYIIKVYSSTLLYRIVYTKYTYNITYMYTKHKCIFKTNVHVYLCCIALTYILS